MHIEGGELDEAGFFEGEEGLIITSAGSHHHHSSPDPADRMSILDASGEMGGSRGGRWRSRGCKGTTSTAEQSTIPHPLLPFAWPRTTLPCLLGAMVSYECTHACIGMHVHVHVHRHVCMHARMCVSLHVCIGMYVCVHACEERGMKLEI